MKTPFFIHMKPVYHVFPVQAKPFLKIPTPDKFSNSLPVALSNSTKILFFMLGYLSNLQLSV